MKYTLYCQHCSNKIFTDGKDLSFLTEIPTASIPKRWNGTDKALFDQRKKLKCPECGYVFTIVKLSQEEPKKEIL